MSESIVPFGKYKGKPVEVLISDEKYLEWCEQQPALVTRYKSVFEAIKNLIGTSDFTPEHNQLQARFLEDEDLLKKIFTKVTQLFSWPNGFEAAKFTYTKLVFEPTFNHVSFDLAICFNIHSETIFSDGTAYKNSHNAAIFMELKPVIGDDYPKILRKASLARKNNLDLVCVYTDFYNGSVNIETVRKMFLSNNIVFLIGADL